MARKKSAPECQVEWGGGQSLFGQCPDVGGIKRNGCSLTAVLLYVLVWRISWIILHILACTCCREYYTQQFKLIVHFYPKYKIFPRLNQHGKKWHDINIQTYWKMTQELQSNWHYLAKTSDISMEQRPTKVWSIITGREVGPRPGRGREALPPKILSHMNIFTR